jgi:hypothetical protein
MILLAGIYYPEGYTSGIASFSPDSGRFWPKSLLDLPIENLVLLEMGKPVEVVFVPIPLSERRGGGFLCFSRKEVVAKRRKQCRDNKPNLVNVGIILNSLGVWPGHG